MASSTREFDVVVYGATGYTGRLCAEVLAKHPSKPRWAIAGRDQNRLKTLRSKLSLSSSVGTIEANNNNVKSLHNMAKQTRSIINIVGPFREMGAEKLVKACTEESTHYFDLSGETGFNETIQKYDQAAKSNGIILAPSVGFDCLPFDLATFLAVNHLQKEQKEQVGQVEVTFKFKGGLSGGTILTMLDMIDTEKSQVQPVRSDWLSPIKGFYNPIQSPFPFFSQPFKGYAILSPFTLHNTRLINQTHGILAKANSPDQFGPKFIYKDGLLIGNGVLAWIASMILRFNLLLLLYLSPLRLFVRKILPRNYGPPLETSDRKTSTFMDIAAVAHSATKNDKSSLARIFAKGEPGYSTTAQMIVEVALFVVQEPDQLHSIASKGGVLTGALIGPRRLSQRLVENAQWTIETQSYDGKSQLKSWKKSQ